MTWLDFGYAAVFALLGLAIGFGLWLWRRPVSPAARQRFEAELHDRDERLS